MSLSYFLASIWGYWEISILYLDRRISRCQKGACLLPLTLVALAIFNTL
ncbi:MAG: hypothetical protein HRU34_22160 [Richelia sp.]|nr:hypothetical protein [Richelia sp.]